MLLCKSMLVGAKWSKWSLWSANNLHASSLVEEQPVYSLTYGTVKGTGGYAVHITSHVIAVCVYVCVHGASWQEISLLWWMRWGGGSNANWASYVLLLCWTHLHIHRDGTTQGWHHSNYSDFAWGRSEWADQNISLTWWRGIGTEHIGAILTKPITHAAFQYMLPGKCLISARHCHLRTVLSSLVVRFSFVWASQHC